MMTESSRDLRRDNTPRKELTRMQRLAISVGPWVIRALALTWRVQTVNANGWRALRAEGKPVMFALWHGELLPLLVEHHDQGVAVLISEHRDGEVIAQIAHRFGFRTIRGSTSRGAARALLAMARTLESGLDVAVTPDGPRGPRHQFAPGALVAAQRAGVPVVTTAVHASRAWHLKSWDAFMIPKPFAKLYVAYGDPTPVKADYVREINSLVPVFAKAMQQTLDSAVAAHKGVA